MTLLSQEDMLLTQLAAALQRGQLQAIVGGGPGGEGGQQIVLDREDCTVSRTAFPPPVPPLAKEHHAPVCCYA
jgi:hypothetical protein